MKRMNGQIEKARLNYLVCRGAVRTALRDDDLELYRSAKAMQDHYASILESLGAEIPLETEG